MKLTYSLFSSTLILATLFLTADGRPRGNHSGCNYLKSEVCDAERVRADLMHYFIIFLLAGMVIVTIFIDMLIIIALVEKPWAPKTHHDTSHHAQIAYNPQYDTDQVPPKSQSSDDPVASITVPVYETVTPNAPAFFAANYQQNL